MLRLQRAGNDESTNAVMTLEGQKIGIAMSGGVDSNAAAALLLDQGAEVVGLTVKMWGGGSRCCSDEDILHAQHVAATLGFPHYVVDFREEFQREIVDYFADEYACGRTPSPCGRCNPLIKFGALMDRAAAMGITRLATGHYARITLDDAGICHMLRGQDETKDQTYFLFALTQQQLQHVLFPLGEMGKDDVRAYCESRGVPGGMRKESQELCFVTSGHHSELTEQLRPEVSRSGWIVDTTGKRLGRHEGIHRYTVGQRKGLGIAVGEPVFVVSLDAEENTVVVGPREALYSATVCVEGVHWISGSAPDEAFAACTKIRYNSEAAASTVAPVSGGHAAEVVFELPQFAVTPGQIAAFYVGDELVGGGWIAKR